MLWYDFDDNYGNDDATAATPTSQTPNQMKSVRIEDEAEQAQLEQDMHNREVVVMTIPKRRLTVVNA